MRLTILLHRAMGACLAMLLAAPVHSQTSQGAQHISNKLPSPEVLELAKTGQPQDLLVELDVGSLEIEISRRRKLRATQAEQQVSKAPERQALIERQAAEDDQAMVSELRQRLRTVKAQAFPRGQRGRAIVLEDYPHSPVVLVRVPDIDSLNEILALRQVKLVNPNARITVPKV